MIKRVLTIIFILQASALFCNSGLTWDSKIHWDKNQIEINIHKSILTTETTVSSARIQGESSIKENFNYIFFKEFIKINLNSRESISDYIERDPGIYERIQKLGDSLNPTKSVLSKNLEILTTTYTYNIYPDLIDIFYQGSVSKKISPLLTHNTYPEYTGLIIYVESDTPLKNSNDKKGNLTRVVLPQIYNENLEEVFNYKMVEEEYIKTWGPLRYTSTFNEDEYLNRVGVLPLRIIAKGIFGKNNSSIIISNRDSEILRGNSNNIEILTQGRIIIIN